MSNLDPNGIKKRKRGDRVFKFKTFGEQGHPVEFNGSFRQNLEALLQFGNLEIGLCGGGVSCWSFQLEVHRHPPNYIFLFVIEEPIELSLNRHCKHCVYIGWGDHMICNKKYHFLVPSKETIGACDGNWCSGQDNSAMSNKFNLVELKGHVMHGVFHSNGFGHLLCINGVEMGSDLGGCQIMEFWNRLCAGLQARKVSLTDKSQKRSIDLRLLYGIAFSEPWFGRWGYKVGRGSFGVTQQMYQKSISAVQNIPLCLLAHHLGSSNHEIPTMFSRYQTLSGHSLVSLGDLFRFILELKSRLPKESTIDSYNPGILVETTCRWSPKRIEMATRVIVEALKRAEFRWVSRQEVRDAARAYIGDTGLLDFVLKSLGNHVVGNYLVRRCLNPVTKVLEYCLEDISNLFPNQEGNFMTSDSTLKAGYKITRIQLMNDMFHLYKHILKEQKSNIGIFASISLASRIILDSKHLVKEYVPELPSKFENSSCQGEKSKLYCTIVGPCIREVPKRVIAPYECVILRNNATFEELTKEVEKTFKELYWGLKNLVVESVVNLNPKGSDFAFRVVKVGSKLVFEGNTGQNGTVDENIYEGGQSNFIVDCVCGAKEDDGERMINCDICEVWQHSRCVKIPNNEEIPSIFLCSRCEQDILVLPTSP
ncbi:hypothetical protein LguiB_025310 [Lonicera macranthoides]